MLHSRTFSKSLGIYYVAIGYIVHFICLDIYYLLYKSNSISTIRCIGVVVIWKSTIFCIRVVVVTIDVRCVPLI